MTLGIALRLSGGGLQSCLLRPAILVAVGIIIAIPEASGGTAVSRELAAAQLLENRARLLSFTAVIESTSLHGTRDARAAQTTITVSGESRRVETLSGANQGAWTHRRVAVWHNGNLASVHGDPEFESRAERTVATVWRASDLHVDAEPLTALGLYDPEPGALGPVDLPSLLKDPVYPFGERVEVAGRRAVVLNLLGRRQYYLDAERGYAVLRMDTFNREGTLQSRMENADFAEVAEGLWVPYRVTRTRFAPGADTDGKTEHRVVAFALDPELDDGVFRAPDVRSVEPIPPRAPRPATPEPTASALAVGQRAPAIETRAVDGRAVNLEEYQGKVVLIQFWATWCRPCLATKPAIIAAYQRYRFQGLEVIGVSLDRDWSRLRTYLDGNPSETWPTLYDGRGWDSAIGQLYEVRSIPLTLLLDGEGTIRYRNPHRGNLHESIETLLAELSN